MSDVIFINPFGRELVYQELAVELTAIEPPVWCRLLASYVEGQGYSAEIVDLNANSRVNILEYLDTKFVVIVCQGHQPSASTQVMPAVIDLCRLVKQVSPSTRLMLVGTHPAALPRQALLETGADYVCTGEGPVSILDVLQGVEPPRGVCRLEHGVPVFTETVVNINVREMPGGQWARVHPKNYRAHNWHCFGHADRMPYASIYTSLGCSFSCLFCCIQAPFRRGDQLALGGSVNSYRMWPVEMVLRELEILIEGYNVQHIKICDEMFVLNYRHVMGICEGIIERGWSDHLNIWCYGRVDCTKDRFLAALRRAGVRWLGLGIESASDQVRDGIDKGQYGEQDIYQTCARIKQHDINIAANFIVGLPGDTYESIEHTFQMAQTILPEWFNIYGCMPYPGSALYEQVKDSWKPEGGWAAYSHHSYDSCPLPTETLTSADVLRFRDEAFRRYYSSDTYQTLIAYKFGSEAVEAVKRMIEVKIKRRLYT